MELDRLPVVGPIRQELAKLKLRARISGLEKERQAAQHEVDDLLLVCGRSLVERTDLDGDLASLAAEASSALQAKEQGTASRDDATSAAERAVREAEAAAGEASRAVEGIRKELAAVKGELSQLVGGFSAQAEDAAISDAEERIARRDLVATLETQKTVAEQELAAARNRASAAAAAKSDAQRRLKNATAQTKQVGAEEAAATGKALRALARKAIENDVVSGLDAERLRQLGALGKQSEGLERSIASLRDDIEGLPVGRSAVVDFVLIVGTILLCGFLLDSLNRSRFAYVPVVVSALGALWAVPSTRWWWGLAKIPAVVVAIGVGEMLILHSWASYDFPSVAFFLTGTIAVSVGFASIRLRKKLHRVNFVAMIVVTLCYAVAAPMLILTHTEAKARSDESDALMEAARAEVAADPSGEIARFERALGRGDVSSARNTLSYLRGILPPGDSRIQRLARQIAQVAAQQRNQRRQEAERRMACANRCIQPRIRCIQQDPSGRLCAGHADFWTCADRCGVSVDDLLELNQ